MSNDNVTQVSDASFDGDILKSAVPVLVDFWAPWCAPCRAIGTLLDEMAPHLSGRIKIAKVNIDENQPLATRFNIRSVPNLLLLGNGNVMEQWIGGMSRPALESKLEPYLS